jgi:adenylate cyclase
MQHPKDAVRYWEKASELMETDYSSVGMLMSCYRSLGDMDRARRAAQRTVARAEVIVSKEPDNGSAMAYAVLALALLGQTERAKEWAERAVLLDPNNLNMQYNLACSLVMDLHEYDAALDLLEPVIKKVNIEAVNWWKIDPDIGPIRDHPRFKAMMAAAEERLKTEETAV